MRNLKGMIAWITGAGSGIREGFCISSSSKESKNSNFE